MAFVAGLHFVLLKECDLSNTMVQWDDTKVMQYHDVMG